MIATGLLVVLLVVRSVSVAATGPDDKNHVPVINRVIGPVALAFVAMLGLRLIDLWISNA